VSAGYICYGALNVGMCDSNVGLASAVALLLALCGTRSWLKAAPSNAKSSNVATQLANR
jgi:hypothetical protein